MKSPSMLAALALALSASIAAAKPLPPLGPYRLHEWGTFTFLLDENGKQIRGINTDDEPAPAFVHRSGTAWVAAAQQAPHLRPEEGAGLPSCDARVSMRLETPVLYFYPDSAQAGTVDLQVSFSRGVLGEFYPNATTRLTGIRSTPGDMTRWTSDLRWQNLQVGVTSTAIPATQDDVWLTPRRVPSATVRTGQGEAEKFLFYRGLGDVATPLRVVRQGESLVLSMAPDAGAIAGNSGGFAAPDAWLVNVARDRSVTWRRLPAVPASGSITVPAVCPAPVVAGEAGLPGLKASMHAALVANGLSDDEATAMLGTWQRSYFASVGAKVFFVALKPWVDAMLPLAVKPAPRELARVMLGRIELVTPEQRAVMAKLAAGPLPSLAQVAEVISAAIKTRGPAWWENVRRGHENLADSDLNLPPLYRDFLALGRFREPLLLDALKTSPNPALADFVNQWSRGYTWQPTPVSAAALAPGKSRE